MKAKKLLYCLLAFIGALLLVGIGAIIFKDLLLKKVAEHRIRKQTGLAAEIGDLTLEVTSATLSVKGIKIWNPREFGSSLLVDIPELSFSLDPDQARAGKLHFKKIRFHLREINVVRNKDGRLNVQVLESKAGNATNSNSIFSSPKNGQSFAFTGIDKMYLTLGKVKYTDLREAGHNEELDLEVVNEVVENLRTPEELKRWYGAFCVRMFLQIVTQQMLNGPDRAQSFGERLKQIRNSIPQWLN